MDRNWDMKAIHKLIVTSSAYKLQSSGWAPDAPQAKADPENVALWRMNTRRMEAEVVRDSVLAMAGKLDTTMGGPEIDETKGHEIFRRSIYFRHAPDLQMDMLKVFDVASPNECYRAQREHRAAAGACARKQQAQPYHLATARTAAFTHGVE